MSNPPITWKWLSEQSDEYKLNMYFTQMCPKKHIMDHLHRFKQVFIKIPNCINRTFSDLEIITLYFKYRHWKEMKSLHRTKNM